jgi:hypothetical protein
LFFPAGKKQKQNNPKKQTKQSKRRSGLAGSATLEEVCYHVFFCVFFWFVVVFVICFS